LTKNGKRNNERRLTLKTGRTCGKTVRGEGCSDAGKNRAKPRKVQKRVEAMSFGDRASSPKRKIQTWLRIFCHGSVTEEGNCSLEAKVTKLNSTTQRNELSWDISSEEGESSAGGRKNLKKKSQKNL